MKTFNVPYAKGFVDINIPDQNIAGVLESKAHSYLSLIHISIMFLTS